MFLTKDFTLLEKLNVICYNNNWDNSSEVFWNILCLIQEYFDSDWCIIRKFDDTEKSLDIIKYTGLSDDEYIQLKTLKTNDYVYDMLVNKKETLVVDNMYSDMQYSNSIYSKNNIMSFVAVPVIMNDKTIGTLKIYNKNLRMWKQSDVILLKIIAVQLGSALMNFTRLNDLKQKYKSAIGSINALLESKDVFTAGHTKRVAYYSKLIARQLRLNEEEINTIDVAAMLHDIGKIVIPDYILNKPGKLNGSEFDIIKKHPTTGAEVLKSGGFSNDIVDIVEQHHERWDGNGYPKGLSQTNIDFKARIIAVADAYEAMTSERNYHIVKSQNEAFAEILKCSGSHFCPTVVAAFLSIDQDLLKNEI